MGAPPSTKAPDAGAHREPDLLALGEANPESGGVLVAVCGQAMLWSVNTCAQPTGRRCPTCEALTTMQVPAPQFGNTPDSDRSLIEQPPPPLPAPGGLRRITKIPGPRGAR